MPVDFFPRLRPRQGQEAVSLSCSVTAVTVTGHQKMRQDNGHISSSSPHLPLQTHCTHFTGSGTYAGCDLKYLLQKKLLVENHDILRPVLGPGSLVVLFTIPLTFD